MTTIRNLKSIGTNNKDILIIVEKIDAEKKYQDFHNKIYHRKSNKRMLFQKDFQVLEFYNFVKNKHIFKNFDVIIVSGGGKIEKEIIQKKLNQLEGEEWQRKEYIIYTDLRKSKIVFFTDKFQRLSDNVLNEISSDVNFFSIKEDTLKEVYSKLKKNIVYYQYNCEKCNKYNLIILHRSEPQPHTCKVCNEIASFKNDQLPNNTLILKNGKLKRIK